MKERPARVADKLPESQADARFKRSIGNLVNTPHKPAGATDDCTEDEVEIRENMKRIAMPRGVPRATRMAANRKG